MDETLTFISDLKKEILEHPVMGHPFWARFREGDLTRKQLQVFSLNYYLHVQRTRLYDAAVLARTPFEDIQAALTSILWDEYGEGNMEQTHPAQFRRLLRALQLSEADWNKVSDLPELQIYTDTHFRLCTDYPFWVGLGVVGVAMELPIPTLYEYLIEGFKKAGLTEEDLEFFIKHGPMDIHHSSLLLDVMIPHLQRKEDREVLKWGALRSLNARLILMDGLYRIVWSESKSISPIASKIH